MSSNNNLIGGFITTLIGTTLINKNEYDEFQQLIAEKMKKIKEEKELKNGKR